MHFTDGSTEKVLKRELLPLSVTQPAKHESHGHAVTWLPMFLLPLPLLPGPACY